MSHFEVDFIQIVGVLVPVLLFMWANKRSAKKDTERRHEQNQRKIDEIIAEQRYLPAHTHIETTGPLEAEGIVRRPTPHDH